jgi:transposase
VEALGNPLRLDLTPGQCQALSLLTGFTLQAVIAHKAYDTNHILQSLINQDIQAVIPPKTNRPTRIR